MIQSARSTLCSAYHITDHTLCWNWLDMLCLPTKNCGQQGMEGPQVSDVATGEAFFHSYSSGLHLSEATFWDPSTIEEVLRSWASSMSSNPASLITTLQSKSELSTLNSFVNSSSKLQTLFSAASDYTFLAPSNDALKSWISTRSTPPRLDEIEATLAYHLVNGSFPTVSFTDQSQFAPTYLTNSSYSNITISPAGQRVQLLLGTEGQPQILSSNKTISTVETKVCRRVRLRWLLD